MKLTKDELENRADLDLYTSIDPEAASEIAEIYDGNELSLNGLTEISVEVAQALESHTYRLELNGLTKISDEVAEVLSRHEGDIGLDGVQELSSQAAEFLSHHDAGYGLIYLGSLKKLTNEKGHVILANHLATSFEGDEIYLDGLEVLEEESAKELAKHEGWLYLNGLKRVSEETLKILATRTAGTSLKGMDRPEIEWSGKVEFK